MAQSLLQAFLTSFVRQLGRDSGKVISNRVYKDAHATPIRHVSSKTVTDSAKARVEKKSGNKTETTVTAPNEQSKAVKTATTESMRKLTHSILGNLMKDNNSTDSSKNTD